MLTGKYDEKLYSNTLDSLDDMNKFLEKHKLPKLTQDKIDNPKSPISITDILLVV